MRTRIALCVVAVVLSCSAASAVTLTFDDVPSGTVLSGTYADGVAFSLQFQATDHSAAGWGPPHSGANVLTCVEAVYSPAIGLGYYEWEGCRPSPTRRVAAYFSTETGAVVAISAYHVVTGNPNILITSVVVGASGESWNNRYVEITAGPGQSFEWLEFAGVNSQDDLLHFCADDMTIIPVPEPGGLIGLASGLGALALPALRRRRL